MPMIRGLALCLFFVAAVEGSEPSVTVPPDRSLTVAEYVELGMPDPTREWGSADARQAWAFLQALYEDDPAKLPRYRSGRSGPLFDKLLAESLTLEATIGDMTINELETSIDSDPDAISARSLMSVYLVRPESGLLFDRELVEILAHTLSETIRMWAESRESEAEIEHLITTHEAAGRDSEATRARQLLRSRAQLEPAIEANVLRCLRELALIPAVEAASSEATESAIWYLRSTYARCQPLFSAEGATRAKEILHAAEALDDARDRSRRPTSR